MPSLLASHATDGSSAAWLPRLLTAVHVDAVPVTLASVMATCPHAALALVAAHAGAASDVIHPLIAAWPRVLAHGCPFAVTQHASVVQSVTTACDVAARQRADDAGLTPLAVACKLACVHAVNALLHAGADAAQRATPLRHRPAFLCFRAVPTSRGGSDATLPPVEQEKACACLRALLAAGLQLDAVEVAACISAACTGDQWMLASLLTTPRDATVDGHVVHSLEGDAWHAALCLGVAQAAQSYAPRVFVEYMRAGGDASLLDAHSARTATFLLLHGPVITAAGPHVDIAGVVRVLHECADSMRGGHLVLDGWDEHAARRVAEGIPHSLTGTAETSVHVT